MAVRSAVRSNTINQVLSLKLLNVVAEVLSLVYRLKQKASGV